MDGDAGPGFYKSWNLGVLDSRLLPDAIDRKLDPIRDASALDNRLTAGAVEGEAHGDDCLQRVALRAASGAYVGLSARNADRVIENGVDRLGRHARAGV